MTACVYTCLFGNYELLNEQPIQKQSQIPFICFTDNKKLQSDTWRIEYIDPILRSDPVRSQRYVKLMPHKFLAQFETSLYIDNTVLLHRRPEEVLTQYLSSADFALFPHSFRETVLDEFIEVVESRLEEFERVYSQLADYVRDYAETLTQRPVCGGILLRRHHCPDVIAADEIWYTHVLRYARRDQLSALAAFQEAGITPLRISDGSIFKSSFHSWPHRQEFDGTLRTVLASREYPAALQSLKAMDPYLVLSSELKKSKCLLQETSLTIAQLERTVAALITERDALINSRSWKLTACLRSLRRSIAPL